MTEVVADHGNVHAGLKERDRAAVAEDMRRDSLPTKGWHFRGCEAHVLREHVCGPVARKRTASSVPEDARCTTVGDDVTQGASSLWPQRAVPFLVAFTANAHVSRTECGALNVAWLERKYFADSGACVVEKEQQGAVTPAGPRARVWASEDRAHLFGLEVGDGASTRLLRSDGQNALVLLRSRDVVTEEMLRQSADSGEAAVASRGGISTTRLEVVQKGEHVFDGDIIEAEVAIERRLRFATKEKKRRRASLYARTVWELAPRTRRRC